MLRFKRVFLLMGAVVLMACRPSPVNQPADMPTVTPEPAVESASQPAAVQVMQMLMRAWLGEPAAGALPVEARQVDWPDACFGAGYPYESCAQAIAPGWEMTFVVEGQRYTFRTDAEAARYRLVEAPPADIGETIVSWSGAALEAEGGCLAAEIGTKSVAFGDCGGPLMVGHFANAANRRLLDQHVARFATFKDDGAMTGGQTLVFTGRGAEMPTPADQRAIAELAHLMALEARSGRAGASWVTAIALRQETTPDRAAMCVSVEMTGQVYVNPCAANAPGQALFLNPSGLDQLYRWIDALSLFDLTVTDKEVVTQIVFSGRGARAATEAEQSAIRAFAEGLIGEAREQQPDLSAGQARYALPLVLPEGLDWNPDAAEASDRSFHARAEDPANPQSRWVEVRGARDALPRPDASATPVTLRGTDGAAYNLAQGFMVMWVEDGTHYAVSASFGLTETVDIAGSLAPHDARNVRADHARAAQRAGRWDSRSGGPAGTGIGEP